MLTNIAQIGNSLGVRIPKFILAKCHLTIEDKINIDTKNGKIVIEAAGNSRKDWDKKFSKTTSYSNKKDKKHNYIESQFDKEEWEW